MILDKYIPGFFGQVKLFCISHSIYVEEGEVQYMNGPYDNTEYSLVLYEGGESDGYLEEIDDDERQDIINNSNDCKRLVSDIMFIVENNREKFNDGEFIELCNNLMELNRRV